MALQEYNIKPSDKYMSKDLASAVIARIKVLNSSFNVNPETFATYFNDGFFGSANNTLDLSLENINLVFNSTGSTMYIIPSNNGSLDTLNYLYFDTKYQSNNRDGNYHQGYLKALANLTNSTEQNFAPYAWMSLSSLNVSWATSTKTLLTVYSTSTNLNANNVFNSATLTLTSPYVYTFSENARIIFSFTNSVGVLKDPIPKTLVTSGYHYDNYKPDLAEVGDGLVGFLTKIARAIRAKKGTTDLIAAEDFPNEISSIESGIDTSDATAGVKDIASDKTAYVNGEKIEGALPVIGSTAGFTLDASKIVDNQSEQMIYGDFEFFIDLIMRGGATVNGAIPYSQLAETIGLTSNKLVSGNTVLGVAGTATLEGMLSEEEYNELLATTNAILAPNKPAGEDITVVMSDSSALIRSVMFGAALCVTGAEVAWESSNMVQIEAWFPDDTETTRSFMFSDSVYDMPTEEFGIADNGKTVYYEYLSDVDAHKYAWKITEDYAYPEISLTMLCPNKQTLEDISSVVNNLFVEINSRW